MKPLIPVISTLIATSTPRSRWRPFRGLRVVFNPVPRSHQIVGDDLTTASPRFDDEPTERLEHARQEHEPLIPREQLGHLVVRDALRPLRAEHAIPVEIDGLPVRLCPFGGLVGCLPEVPPRPNTHGPFAVTIYLGGGSLEPREVHGRRDERGVGEPHVLGLDRGAADFDCAFVEPLTYAGLHVRPNIVPILHYRTVDLGEVIGGVLTQFWMTQRSQSDRLLLAGSR